jgi:hypothetical protein
MNYVCILETTNYVGDCLRFSNVRQKLITEPLAFGRARYQASDINKFHDARNYSLRPNDLCKAIQPRVRNRYNARIRLNRTEREILRLNLRVGERIK